LDVDRFLEALKTYPRAEVEGIRNLKGRGGDPFNMPVGNLAPIAESEWRDARIAQSTKQAVLSFMLACGAAGRADIIADLRYKVMLVPGLAKEVENLFRVMDEPSDEEKDIYVIISSIVGRLLSGEVFDTNDVFLSAIYVVRFGRRHRSAWPNRQPGNADDDIGKLKEAETLARDIRRFWESLQRGPASLSLRLQCRRLSPALLS